MEKKNKSLVLNLEKDYEFVKLILYIKETGFGEFKVKIENGIPYQIIELQKSILLRKSVSS